MKAHGRIEEQTALVAACTGLVELIGQRWDKIPHKNRRHYTPSRPPTSLDGAIPAEIYFGLEPANRNAEHPPRSRPGEGPQVIPFKIVYVDRKRRLSILKKVAVQLGSMHGEYGHAARTKTATAGKALRGGVRR